MLILHYLEKKNNHGQNTYLNMCFHPFPLFSVGTRMKCLHNIEQGWGWETQFVKNNFYDQDCRTKLLILKAKLTYLEQLKDMNH